MPIWSLVTHLPVGPTHRLQLILSLSPLSFRRLLNHVTLGHIVARHHRHRPSTRKRGPCEANRSGKPVTSWPFPDSFASERHRKTCPPPPRPACEASLSVGRMDSNRHLLAVSRRLRERHGGVAHVAVRLAVAKLGEYAGRVRLAGHRAPAAPGHDPELGVADVVEERLRADVALREAPALGDELDHLGRKQAELFRTQVSYCTAVSDKRLHTKDEIYVRHHEHIHRSLLNTRHSHRAHARKSHLLQYSVSFATTLL